MVRNSVIIALKTRIVIVKSKVLAGYTLAFIAGFALHHGHEALALLLICGSVFLIL